MMNIKMELNMENVKFVIKELNQEKMVGVNIVIYVLEK